MNSLLLNRSVIPGRVLLIMTLVCGLVFFFDNGIYLFCCLATLLALLAILWKTRRPGILVFAFVMQWTQVVTYVLWMNTLGFDINRFSPHAGVAVVMSCVGLLTMAIVISSSISGLKIPTAEEFSQAASLFNTKKLLTLYIVSVLFLDSIGFALGATSGFAQILVTLSFVKWIFFLLYGYITWIRKENKLIFIAIILFEFSTSLYSYFSSFKEVILITIILALTFARNINFRQIIYSIVLIAALGTMLITWTAIKSEYRNYLNNGTRHQIVTVSREQALDKMGSQLGDLTWARYQIAINVSLYRLQYVFHLARVMDRVPDMTPHEDGRVWWNNISYVLLPRLLFPGKPLFDATEKTNKYTGLNYSGLKQGASFGLGYFADGYIDFGYIGMLAPLALLALFVSASYRTFYKMLRLNILIRYGLINVGLYNFISFESDGTFLFGRLLITFLVFGFLARTVFPYLQKWLYKK